MRKTDSEETISDGDVAGDANAQTWTDRRLHSADGPIQLDGFSLARPAGFHQRYTTECSIGEGGMGSVLMCQDGQIGRRVAVKVIRTDLAGDEQTQARFVREARVQGQLEHPAVVPVYDLGVTPEGSIYFTMKRVKGVTLEAIVAGLSTGDPKLVEQFTTRRLLTAFSSVCLAVAFAHERQVLHRDLKPANIMLGDFGEVYVLDWGLAKVIGQEDLEPARVSLIDVGDSAQTRPGALLGTPGYMAPEQLDGRAGQVGPQSDVYALGALLFEILTLSPLHPRGNLTRIVASTLGGTESRPSVHSPDRGLPPELDAVCVKATASKVEERYESARQLHGAIERYLEGQRDEELRRQMANRHADLATEAAGEADSGEGTIARRKLAMRQIGRALALDPGNKRAMETLVTLLNTPPPSVPEEVQIELDRSTRHQNRITARTGFYVYGGLFLALPLVLWLGILQPSVIVLFYALAALASGVSLWASLRKRPPAWTVVLTMVVTTTMFGLLSSLMGSLVLTPILVIANAVPFVIHLERGPRLATIGCAALAIIVPFSLELAGVVSPSYTFSEAGMTIVPRAIELSGPASLWLLGISSLTALLICTGIVSNTKRLLREAEQRVYLYAWHLREFVPDEAKVSTDPTVARKTRRPGTSAASSSG